MGGNYSVLFGSFYFFILFKIIFFCFLYNESKLQLQKQHYLFLHFLNIFIPYARNIISNMLTMQAICYKHANMLIMVSNCYLHVNNASNMLIMLATC